MSFNIPSEAEENRVLAECDSFQRQLDYRFERLDNPFCLTVDPDLPGTPPPMVEGQVIAWRHFDKAGRYGKCVGRDYYEAIRVDGRLVWAYNNTR